jgi:endonuclease/exonuclease/phosphatase (EEP) superfamily protein YafD
MDRDGRAIKITLLAGFVAMLVSASALNPARSVVSLAPAIDLTEGGWRVRILTWNIGYAYGKDDSRAKDSDLGKVAGVIKREQPDVVALQELSGRPQLRALLRRLRGEYQGFLDNGEDADRYTAILVHAPKMQFRAIRTSTGRSASAAVFRVARSPLKFCAISAHAQAWDAAARAKYTSEIVDWVRENSFDVAFLAGDFNFDVGGGHGGGGLFTEDPTLDAEAYAYVTRYFRDLGRDGGSTAAFKRRIDYVFGRGGNLHLKRADVLRGWRTGGMDHDPLVIDAVITGPVQVSKRS